MWKWTRPPDLARPDRTPPRWAALPACLLALLFAAPSHADVSVSVERDLTIASPVLGRPISYSIYLPQAARDKGRRFPVLYLLHGLGDDQNAWLEHGGIAATLDRKIANGELQPLIVVMPMAGNSWYVDDARSSGYGNMSEALTGDLITAIDRLYPTAPCSQARAVGGLSMGGYGAILYALSKPALFAAAFSLSGSLFTSAIAETKVRQQRSKPMFGGVYGDTFDPERFKAWTVFDRLDKAPQAAAGLKYWLAAADKDFGAILSGTVRLHQELLARNMASELRISGGGHTWEFWSTAVDPALSWLSPILDPTCRRTRVN